MSRAPRAPARSNATRGSRAPCAAPRAPAWSPPPCSRPTAPSPTSRARGLLGIPEDVVATWTEDERRQALAWVDGGLSLEEIPDVLGQPHRAAAAGADEQHCAACGARILRLNAGDGDVQPYPEGALVGMHCTGVETAAPAAEDAPATAAAEV